MKARNFEGSGLRRALSIGIVAGSAILLGLHPTASAAVGKTDPPPAAGAGSSKDKRPAEPVKITLQFLRTDTVNAADLTGTTVTVGTPILTMLDGSTASMAVTGEDLSYTLGFSPKIESHGKMVQILWSIRISGKSLPGGATGMTMTGASQVTPDAMAGIAEISVADPVTGRKSVFRIQGVTTTGDTAGTVGIVSPTSTAMPVQIPPPAPPAPPTR